MEVKRFRRSVLPVLFLYLSFLSGTAVQAEVLQEVTIRQVYLYQDAMHTYLDLNDGSGVPITQPKENSIQAYLDNRKLSTQHVQTFGDSGEAMAYIFLLDISGSLSDAQFSQMKACTVNWAENMGENDRMAIVTFGNETSTLLDYTGDVEAVKNALDSLHNNDNYTQLYGGIEAALKLTTRNDTGLPKRKAILLLTDGLNDFNGGITQDEILDMVRQDVIPFYNLWSGSSGSTQGEAFLNTLSNASRGEVYHLGKQSIQDIYDSTYDRFHKAFVVDFSYPLDKADGAMHNLKISVRDGSVESSYTIDFIMSPPTESLASLPIGNTGAGEETEKEKGMSTVVILALAAAGIIIIALILVLVALFIRKKRPPRQVIGHSSVITPEMANVPRPEPELTPVAVPSQAVSPPSSGGLPLTLTDLSNGMIKKARVIGRLDIGRSSDCGLVLDDPQVSGHHCAITAENGRFFAEDCGSTNGTVVNGIEIHGCTELQNGDLLLLGSKEYRISMGV